METRPGFWKAEVDRDLSQESGGHRIQRVPANERSGRVHTSTVTVAYVSGEKAVVGLVDSDLRIEYFSGTGAGGQHRNKKQCSVRMMHVPSGTVVIASSRKREDNLREARREMEKRIGGAMARDHHDAINNSRANQIGSGMRGDKIRTYRFRDNLVEDHRTGKSGRCSEIMKGRFDLLWK